MMKKYKSMIILLAVFVVLIILYFVMIAVNKSKSEAEQDETFMMTEISDVNSVEYTDGETTLSFVKEDGTWKLAEDASVETDTEDAADSSTSEVTALDSDAVQTIADTLGQIQAVRVLEGAGEISEYGLDEPAYTIRLQTESGAEASIYIGNATGENYYATIGDKVVVYVIKSSAVDALEFDVTVLEAEEEETDEAAVEE